ncbi:MAG TPA: dihydrolipoyl dehydrogenase, partial [Kofleriaceae bacterium]|nr:dihydrolipoyl dehydrogenase [Kofleriaceae bacterium]
MAEQRFDAVVIGAGPGGYPTAIRLGQLKVKTAIIEREYMGGVCLNVGCIPSKAVIHAAKTYEKFSHSEEIGITVASKPVLDMKKLQAWKGGVVNKLTGGVRTLLKGNGVEVIDGTAKLEKSGPDGHRITVTGKNGTSTIIAKNIVIATGSRPMTIPGFNIDQKRMIDSTGALALDAVPPRLIVIGGGYIGLELGMVYAKFGSKVTVVEATPNLLGAMDKDCVAVVARKLKKLGVEVMLDTKAKSWEDKGDRAVLNVELKDGTMSSIDTDKILMSIGRRPNTEDLGLDAAGVTLDKRGYIVANDQLKTNVAGIYAIGDVIGGMMLAHKATKEGEVVAEIIAGHKAAFDVRCIPAVVFTD